MLFIRENSDGEYSGAGDWLFTGKPEEVVLQTGVFSRKGTERIIRYAFETASDLGKTLTSISKANALNYSMVFWDQVFEEVSQEYPHVETASYLVDAAALTPDVGGTFSTIEVGDAVVELIESKYVSRRISF